MVAAVAVRVIPLQQLHLKEIAVEMLHQLSQLLVLVVAVELPAEVIMEQIHQEELVEMVQELQLVQPVVLQDQVVH